MLETPEYLLRKTANREWEQPKRKRSVAVNKAVGSCRSKECFDIRHGDAEFGVCPAGYNLALVHYFLTLSPSLHFGMAMYILCHYMLELYELPFFVVYFYRWFQLRDCMNLRRDFELCTFKHCWNFERLWRLLKLQTLKPDPVPLFLLPADPDAELSAASSAPCLPACCHANAVVLPARY